MLPFSHIVQDPAVPMEQHYQISLQPQRLCDGCFEELSRPRGTSSNSRPTSVRMGRSSSVQSIMMECPVCGRGLEEFGSMNEQEQHVQTCLNANTPAALSGIRYVGKLNCMIISYQGFSLTHTFNDSVQVGIGFSVIRPRVRDLL